MGKVLWRFLCPFSLFAVLPLCSCSAKSVFECFQLLCGLLSGFVRMAPMRFPHEPGLEQQAHLSEFCRGLESFAPAVLDFRNSLCLTKAARRFNASSRSR